MDIDLQEELTDKLLNGELALWIGAGLSMGGESGLPSADSLAAQCAARYRTEYGRSLPEAATNSLDSMCSHFHNSGELESTFINRLVDWPMFKEGDANDSHFAIADFLLTRAVSLGISTNFDTRIETAAVSLGNNRFDANLRLTEQQPTTHSRLFKIHGCASKDKEATLWCAEQVEDPPFSELLPQAEVLLPGELVNKDLVIVGYWTDWPHLYAAICKELAGSTPNRVYLVNPLSPARLKEEATQLWEWSQQYNAVHIQEYSDDFFNALRRCLGYRLLNIAINNCEDVYNYMYGEQPPVIPDMQDLATDNVNDLYLVRSDLAGVPRSEAIHTNVVTEDRHKYCAAAMRRLIGAGAVYSDDALYLKGRRIRVIAKSGILAEVQAQYSREESLHQRDTIMVCPLAIDSGGAESVVRATQQATIVRNRSEGIWVSSTEDFLNG